MIPGKKLGFLGYVKRAFLQHWNLLLFGAGAVAAAISGHADIALPLVAAGEIVYLTGLASHRKFQAHIDAQLHKAAKEANKGRTDSMLERILATLDANDKTRFEELKQRCTHLRSLAAGLRRGRGAGLDRLQAGSINKLLWAFLKLLYSRHVLKQFLDSTNEQRIRGSRAKLEGALAELGPEVEDTPEKQRRRHALRDTLASVDLRLENLKKARDNFELLQIELDRIETKVTSVAELAVNRQDPEFVTTEVDGVAATMAQTEAAMSELHLLRDLDSTETPPPVFLDEKLELQ